MSLFSTLSVAQSGLNAASTVLQVTANNVSNAGQEGFTRKSAVLSSANLGDVGGGVKITGFTRASNDVLFTTLSKATSDAGMREAQDEYLQQIQDILGTSGSDNPPLSENLTAFVNSWTSLSAEPESNVAQTQVIQNAVVLTDEIRRAASEIEALDRQCSKDISSSLTDLNAYLSQIKDLNLKISQATTSGNSAGDLEDQRDQIVLKVSELASVTVLPRENGQIALYSTTGYQLVDGSYARSFSYDGTNITADNNPGLSLNTALVGGRVEALVDFRDSSASAASSTTVGVGTIQKMRSQLDAIANAFLSTVSTATSGEDTFAAAYNGATTAAGELGASFFTGSNRTDIVVNASLLDGSAKVKKTSADPVVDALLDSTRSFSASGLTTSGANYSSLVTASLTTFQQAANNVGTLNDTASSQKNYLTEKLTNETNVNVDTEMVNLVSMQNIYAANARVMSIVKELFSVLQNMVV